MQIKISLKKPVRFFLDQLLVVVYAAFAFAGMVFIGETKVILTNQEYATVFLSMYVTVMVIGFFIMQKYSNAAYEHVYYNKEKDLHIQTED